MTRKKEAELAGLRRLVEQFMEKSSATTPTTRLTSKVISCLNSNLQEMQDDSRKLRADQKKISAATQKLYNDYADSQRPEVHKLISQLALDCKRLQSEREINHR